MFEFKGTAAGQNGGSGPEWRIVDHRNIQDLGRRPFTTMLLPVPHQRRKTEGARRPSPPLRSRSNASAPNYSRPQDTDDLSPVAASFGRRTPRSSVDRRSLSGGSTPTKGDSLDIFTPKAWMAKGSKFLKRENSKHDLTSLRTLDWVEGSQETPAQRSRGPPPPRERRHSRTRPPGDSSVSRLNISEPFNFHHITHTRPHHVQQLEAADPNDLVSEFSALRASQASQPELRGIKAKDIQREDLPCDALLPDRSSNSRNQPTGWPRAAASRTQDSTPDSPCGPMSPVRASEHSRLTENFSHPSAGYHTAHTSPISPTFRTSSRHLTPDCFTFHHESPSDTTLESPIPTESSEPLDYSTGTWNDGVYDLASPHAVTTDESADWTRQVPFTMVKTELAPVEEDDETEEPRTSILASNERGMTPASILRSKKSSPSAKTIYCGSDTSMQVSGNTKGFSSHPIPAAEDSPRGSSARLEEEEEDISDSPHGHCIPPAKILEPLSEDPLDDIPVRSRFSRCMSVGANDMERFWDMASDAINYSYAHGAEGDSNFDWHRYSIHEDDMTTPVAEDIQTNAADAPFKSPNRKPQSDSPSPSRIAARRSSSVYSSSPPPLMPLQTFPSKLDPPSATSTGSSFSSIPEAVTPDETMESALATEFSTGTCKEWYRSAFIVPNDSESQTVQEDLYQQMYTGDYPQEASFQIPNVGRIDGSTISNSPRSSRSPISKSSSQESFWFSQAAFNARRPRNAGSVGSLPELVSSKNSRERFDSAADQSTDNLTCLNPSDPSSDSQQACAVQRRRSPNLAKDAAQNIMLSKVKTAEEPLRLLPASHGRATSDPTSASQDLSVAPLSQPAAAKRIRSGSSPSNPSVKGSRGSYNLMPPPQTISLRSP